MADERDSPAFGRGGPVAGTLPARERLRPRPVARAWADSRVQSIFGGTTEIMKEIIGRGLGL